MVRTSKDGRYFKRLIMIHDPTTVKRPQNPETQIFEILILFVLKTIIYPIK